jgi:translation elongation factor EF-G
MRDEDPTLDVHQDEQTGDLIVGGLSQMHVEVIAGRIERRFGVAMDLAPPIAPEERDLDRAFREQVFERQACVHAVSQLDLNGLICTSANDQHRCNSPSRSAERPRVGF